MGHWCVPSRSQRSLGQEAPRHFCLWPRSEEEQSGMLCDQPMRSEVSQKGMLLSSHAEQRRGNEECHVISHAGQGLQHGPRDKQLVQRLRQELCVDVGHGHEAQGLLEDGVSPSTGSNRPHSAAQAISAAV
eukprot:444420-Pelagomonas_calceolata.AAC.1